MDYVSESVTVFNDRALVTFKAGDAGLPLVAQGAPPPPPRSGGSQVVQCYGHSQTNP
jgi:hypothetical protein